MTEISFAPIGSLNFLTPSDEMSISDYPLFEGLDNVNSFIEGLETTFTPLNNFDNYLRDLQQPLPSIKPEPVEQSFGFEDLEYASTSPDGSTSASCFSLPFSNSAEASPILSTQRPKAAGQTDTMDFAPSAVRRAALNEQKSDLSKNLKRPSWAATLPAPQYHLYGASSQALQDTTAGLSSNQRSNGFPNLRPSASSNSPHPIKSETGMVARKRKREAGYTEERRTSPLVKAESEDFKPRRGSDRKVSKPRQAQNIERHRERNRRAADKCRKKKHEWTKDLEAQARALEHRRNFLKGTVEMLSTEVLALKEEVLRHTQCGCDRIQQYLDSRVAQLMVGATGTSPGRAEQAYNSSPSDDALGSPDDTPL